MTLFGSVGHASSGVIELQRRGKGFRHSDWIGYPFSIMGEKAGKLRPSTSYPCFRMPLNLIARGQIGVISYPSSYTVRYKPLSRPVGIMHATESSKFDTA